jgi:thiol-disulfide isomerase/thioredoxin
MHGFRPGPKCAPALLAAALSLALFPAAADESFPSLQVGAEVYSNVVVTSRTATDIYFIHSRGMSNAKLKNLSPDLQKHFGYDPAKAGEAEASQLAASAQYRAEFTAAQAAAAAAKKDAEAPDPVAPRIYAKSFLGQRPPSIIVDQWITPPPQPDGKFVLVNFWSVNCEPCKDTIAYLNSLNANFQASLVIIGLTADSAEDLKKWTGPKMNYSVGMDTQGRTQKALEIQGLPHSILIDPTGIVRYEGVLAFLDEKGLRHLLAKYAPQSAVRK